MNLSALFIRRPVMTTLVMLSIIIFGLMGYRRLPVSDLPNVDFPTLMVSANLPAPVLKHGCLRGHSLGAPIHHHRRCDGHEFYELPRSDADHSAV